MLAGIRSSLELRMMILASTGLLAGFGLFAGLGLWAVGEVTSRATAERELLARVVADRAAHVVEENLDLLQSVAFDSNNGSNDRANEVVRRSLHEVYLRTIFGEGVYLLDPRGQLLAAEPSAQWVASTQRDTFIQRAIELGRPLVSDAYVGRSGTLIASALIPLRDGLGHLTGVVGGDINLSDRHIQEIVRNVTIGTSGYGQIIDASGNVIGGRATPAMTDHERTRLAALVGERQAGSSGCRACHESSNAFPPLEQEIVYAPVAGAPWSVFVRQDQTESQQPMQRLRELMLLAGLPLFLAALAVAWVTARSVVRPLADLCHAADAMAAGDLSNPVPQAGDDEVGLLASTFETMRRRLRESLDRIQGWNAELEDRVNQRTQQLIEQERVGHELLRKVISAQEEERRRIARELHDETSQSLAALIVATDTAALAPPGTEAVRRGLDAAKSLAVQILDGVHKLIYDLRPSMLDDLGLVAALRWYAESRLRQAGIGVSVEVTGEERRLAPEIETTLFRTLQEGISNVAKHSSAETALVRLEFRDDGIAAEIEDDGEGFDPAAVKAQAGKMQGLGLMGMQERIGLLRGTMGVVSRPGHGTRLHFAVPVDLEDQHHENDPCPARR